MEPQSWLCSSCEHTPASTFCLCQAAGVLLCEGCFPSHLSKNPNRDHHAHPTAAYPFRNVPGYLHRLRQRSEAIPRASADLRENIAVIDRCLDELAQKAEVAIAAIRKYVENETQKLASLRAKMQRDVEEAIAEAERTLYDHQPVMTSKYGEKLRSGKRIRLFEYAVSASATVPKAGLELLFSSDGEAQEFITLPQISGSTLQRHNIRTGQNSSAGLPISFNNSAFCLLDEDTVLCAGGFNPLIAAAWLLHVSEARFTQLPPMRTPRSSGALIKPTKFGKAYLFGGWDTKAMQACEKFGGDSWTLLPNMQKPRAHFSACSLGEVVFLPCLRGFADGVMETFNSSSEEFKAHPVRLPDFNTASVAFIVDGELIVIAQNGQMGRLHLDTEDAFRISPINLSGKNPSSNIPPIRYGREVFWASFSHNGILMKFNLDSKVFTS